MTKDCTSTSDCEQRPPGWQAQEEQERAKDADIVVKAFVNSIHYYGANENQYVAACTLKCLMNEPYNLLNFNKQFNVTSLGAFSGICQEHHVTEGKDYILFLQRHFPIFPLPGQTVPPSIMDNYILGPHEVNLQEATFEFTPDIEQKFSDYLAKCGGAKELMFLPLLALCLLVSLAYGF
nr:uncharacterized protein LOC100180302 [Phallusia mammillata]